MPLLDDCGFTPVESTEDVWENNPDNDNDNEFDECNFLGFATTKEETHSVKVNGNGEHKESVGNRNKQKKRRSKKSINKNIPKANTKLHQLRLEPDEEFDSASNATTSPETPAKRSKRLSNERSPTKERPGSNGGWEVCLRQRTQVFHYYQEPNLRSEMSLAQTKEKRQKTKSESPGRIDLTEEESRSSDSEIRVTKTVNSENTNGILMKATVKLEKIEPNSDKMMLEAKSDLESKTSADTKSEDGQDLDDSIADAEIRNIENNSEKDTSISDATPKKPRKYNKKKALTALVSSSRPVRKSKKKLKRFLSAERSNTPDGIWHSVSRSPSPVTNEIVETSDNSNGVIVWAKLAKYPWWPAIIIDGGDCSRQPAGEGCQWIFWLGDHKISKLATSQMVEFVTNYKFKINERGSKQYFRSVIEALTICVSRCGVKIGPDDTEGMLQWAKEGFFSQSKKIFPFSPNPLDPIPDFIKRRQEKIRKTSVGDKAMCDSTLNTSFGRDCISSAIAKVKLGQLKITEMCLACDSIDAPVVVPHPIFDGGLCKLCKEELRETVYAIGEDGTSSYCAVCGSPGELIICDHPGCSKVYCSSCIKLYAAEGELDKVVNASPWICYFCRDYDPAVHGHLRKSQNSELHIIQLFQAETHVLNIYPDQSFSKKRPIRVLSLFDGIGTGRLVLDNLNIEVEIYYSSEIDSDSILVASVHHKITQLGNVESLSDAILSKLCPFDLLIGGSPCNDLSLVNPARKGLYDPTGTGRLFFDYFRILKAIQLNNKNNHLFWLFENVASMPHEYRDIISRFLQCEPSLIDSKYFSPQNRARYYWGNIPGLYSAIPTHLVEQDIPLQSIITPNCNRKAVVEKVRCITTRSNSLVQKGGAYPVDMNGKEDSLWINELEKAFGFPEHHTDIGNLSFNRRQQLLGRAWTVPVIEYILKPLTNFFKVKNEPLLPKVESPSKVNSERCPSPSSSSSSSSTSTK